MLSFCINPGNKYGDTWAAPDARFDVTIAGEINLDLVLDGIEDPMPVERELLASSFRITLGSSAAILAHNLSALGTRVGFASLAAKDDFSKMALAYLAERKVDLSGVRYSDSPAGSGVTIVVNHRTVRHILSYLGTTSEMSVSASRCRISVLLPAFSSVVVVSAEGAAQGSAGPLQEDQAKGPDDFAGYE